MSWEVPQMAENTPLLGALGLCRKAGKLVNFVAK